MRNDVVCETTEPLASIPPHKKKKKNEANEPAPEATEVNDSRPASSLRTGL